MPVNSLSHHWQSKRTLELEDLLLRRSRRTQSGSLAGTGNPSNFAQADSRLRSLNLIDMTVVETGRRWWLPQRNLFAAAGAPSVRSRPASNPLQPDCRCCNDIRISGRLGFVFRLQRKYLLNRSSRLRTAQRDRLRFILGFGLDTLTPAWRN